MSAAEERLDDWLNKEAVAKDDITAFPLTALAATLDRDGKRRYRSAALALAVLSAGGADVRSSAPTVIRSAAVSCRRCRCRAACGRAVG